MKMPSAVFFGAVLCCAFAAQADLLSEVWVAEDGNDTTGDGSSGAPFATITNGIAHCADNGTVWVKKGTYSRGGTLDRAVTVRGETGDPEDVIIDKNGSAGPTFVIKTPGAMVTGLTVQNASGSYVTGMGFQLPYNSNNGGGTVSNCVVRNCYCTYFNEGAGISADAKSIITHCVISNCWRESHTHVGSTGGLILKGSSKAIKCLIAYNREATSDDKAAGGLRIANANASAIDCTIVGNTGAKTGGVTIESGTLKNCIVVGNKGKEAAYNNVHPSHVARANACATDDDEPLNETCVRDLADNFFEDMNIRNLKPTANPPATYGYYTVDPTVPKVSMKVDKKTGISPLSVAFHVDTQGIDTDDTLTYAWTFDNGTPSASSAAEQSVSFPAGKHAATLSVTSTKLGKTLTHVRMPFIAPYPATMYVKNGNAKAVYPYADENTAAAKLSDATSNAGVGSKIYVLPETYTSGATLSCAAEIIGTTGNPEDVIIKGAISLSKPNGKLSGVTISGVTGGGCALNVGGANCVVSNCVVRNRTGNNGYDVPSVKVTGSGCLLTHCVISNNVSNGSFSKWGHMGGLWLYGGSTCAESLIQNNRCTASGTECGGVQLGEGSKLINCTVVGNKGTAVGGVKVMDSASSVINCALVDNKGTTDTKLGDQSDPADSSRYTTCVQTADTDVFKNYLAGDLTPTKGSALVDGGTARLDAPEKDLAGNTRVMGSAIDIGACEDDPSQFTVSISCAQRTGFRPATLDLSAVYTVGAQDETVATWTFVNGTATVTRVVQNSPDVQVTLSDAGLWDVTVLVSNKTTKAWDATTTPAYLTVAPKTMYVTKGNAGEAYPYDTPATAAKNVTTATEAVLIDGQEIIVAPETYTISKSISLNRATTLRGATGRPEDVIIDRNGSANDTACSLSAAGAVLRDVTIIRGVTGCGGGAGLHLGAGFVSNCVVRSCWCGGSYQSSAVYADGMNARLVGCVISNNTQRVNDNNFISAGLTLRSGARAESCLVIDNRHTDNGADGVSAGGVALGSGLGGQKTSLVNCTIVGNSGKFTGGVAFASDVSDVEVANCVIASNLVNGVVGFETNFKTARAALFDHSATDVDLDAGTFVVGTLDEFFVGGEGREYKPRVPGKLYNAGRNDAVLSPLDLLGRTRIYGRRVDIGAVEAQKITGMMLLVR